MHCGLPFKKKKRHWELSRCVRKYVLNRCLHADYSLFLTLNQPPHSPLLVSPVLSLVMRWGCRRLEKGWVECGGQSVCSVPPCRRGERWGPSCARAGARECYGRLCQGLPPALCSLFQPRQQPYILPPMHVQCGEHYSETHTSQGNWLAAVPS